MNEQRYESLVRLLAAGVAVLLWVISIFFSVDGFNFILPNYQWIGYSLAISVTVLELVFVEEGMGHSLTIAAVGLLSYAYGIATNVVGIWVAQGSPNVLANPAKLLFPVTLGFFLEVTPLPLILWSLLGSGMRDILAQLFGGKNNKEAY